MEQDYCFLFICYLSIFSMKHIVDVGDFLQGQILTLLTLKMHFYNNLARGKLTVELKFIFRLLREKKAKT